MAKATGQFDISYDFHEDLDFEAKAAQGKDGEGAVPKSIWETYSAMANTDGGVIILGVEQKGKELFLIGIKDPDKLRKQIWDCVHDKSIVSENLLTERDVAVEQMASLNIVRISVPRATRNQRPVYVGTNPLTGTYRRNFEGDYKCDPQTVKRMLADANDQSADGQIFPNFDLNDINKDSLAHYRNELKATNANHPFLGFGDLEFLRRLNGWKRDRQTKEEGLTLAGLLMFGNLESILEACPNYILDYQEREQGSSAFPWSDRITTDYSWSGNLYDFFRRVYPRLTSDLKVPFALAPHSRSKRVDQTSVHGALREAFVNMLIHADYNGRVGLLIHKRPDLFGFRNPGGLRLPLDLVLVGGNSDCRNRTLQKMFQLIGQAEQSGSGIPKILRAWAEYHMQVPLLSERQDPDQTILKLPLESLLPAEAIAGLEKLFPGETLTLDSVERIALVTAYSEGQVTNERIRACTAEHARDLTIMFKGLVDRGLLVQEGIGRGTRYTIPGRLSKDNDRESLFDSDTQLRPEKFDPISGKVDGGLHKVDAEALKVDGTQSIQGYSRELYGIAAQISSSLRSEPGEVENVIVQLCSLQALSVRDISTLLNRSPTTVTNKYLNRLLKSGRVGYTIPETPRHPDQAYTTIKK